MKKTVFFALITIVVFMVSCDNPTDNGTTHTHTWGSWTETTAPTCTEAGVETRTCIDDSAHKETRTGTVALGHDWEWQITTPATETEDGVETKTCLRCRITDGTRANPKHTHNWSEWTVKTPVTCTVDGIEERTCITGGEIETKSIPALGHDWEEWQVTTPPTTSTEGIETKICKREQSHIETRPIPILTSFNVTFIPTGGDWNGSTTNKIVHVEQNSTVADPGNPVHQFSTFQGWYTAQSGGTAFALSTPITADITLYAHWSLNVSALYNYITTMPSGGSTTNPIPLKLNFDLGTMTQAGSGWQQLLGILETASKYVTLDLSECIMNGTIFNPVNTVSEGKDKIVSIIFPNVGRIISGGDTFAYAFTYFSVLKEVIGLYITNISYCAFQNCTSLTSVSFPAVTNIGAEGGVSTAGGTFWGCISLTNVNFPVATVIACNAFNGCTSLTSVSFPMVTNIGDGAFNNCTNLISISFPEAIEIDDGWIGHTFSNTSLTSVNLPKVTRIGTYAFDNCSSLTTINFPEATIIGTYAFSNCSSLTTVNFPEAIVINGGAFFNCTSLITVILPKVTTIGDAASILVGMYQIGWAGAFGGCTSLVNVGFPAINTIGTYAFSGSTSLSNVNVPLVTSIGNAAFAGSGTTSLTITLGTTAPIVGANIFEAVTTIKPVIVMVPITAISYGTSPIDVTTNNWGNAFRGRGWNGSTYLTGTVNTNINLTIDRN